MMKLLLVEDERELADNVSAYLANEGNRCELARSYNDADDCLAGFRYDIVVLDLMLPDGNGMDILRMIKKQYPDTGVLIISAKNALDDKIKGLELGADDYLTKPFHLPELNARIKAIYRRRKFQGKSEVKFNELKVNTDTLETWVSDQLLSLTVKEHELLLFFIANRNRVLTKQSIAEHLWGDNVDFLDSFDFVYQHIKNLRKKITAAGGSDYIRTVYGMGYRFNE